MVQATFSHAIASLNLSKVVASGGQLYEDPTKCSELYLTGSGLGPYTFGLVAEEHSGAVNLTVALAGGAGLSTSVNTVSEASNEIRIEHDNERPRVGLAVNASSISFNLTAVVTLTEPVLDFTKDDFTTRGCAVVSLTENTDTSDGGVGAAYTALLTIANERTDISIRVGENVTTDAFGNGNEASNEIFYDNPGYHSPGLTFEDAAGARVFVPWGGAFCVTPADESVRTSKSSGLEEAFIKITVNETNFGSAEVAANRKNYLKYDDNFLSSTLDYPLFALGVNETVSKDHQVLMSDLGGPSDDALTHTISLVLDANGRALEFAPIELMHCNYTSLVNACTCAPDLDLGTEITIGQSKVPWGSERVCIYPESVTQESGAPVVNMA